MDMEPCLFYFSFILYASLATNSSCCGLTCRGDEILYITPSTNICPTEPCLTLSQFAIGANTTVKSNTTLLFLPGYHSLCSELTVSNVKVFSMLSNSKFYSPALNVICQHNSTFKFENIGHILIQGLMFVGCGSKFISVHELGVEYSMFLGQKSNGIALAVVKTIAKIENSFFVSNTAGTYRGYIGSNGTKIYGYVGGAIIANQSNVDIQESKFQWNSAEVGGAIFATNNSNITIINSVFADNHVMLLGGVIVMEYGKLSIYKSQFSSSIATVGGVLSIGRLIQYPCTMNISESSFRNNYAGKFGGVIDMSYNGSVTITRSRFAHNSAGTQGGVMTFQSDLISVMISNCEFSNNTANLIGGGVANSNGICHCDYH